MSRSLEVVVLANIRVAGTNDDRFPGVPFGGTYYPAGTDAEGKPISARFECNAYINRGHYTNQSTGQKVDKKPDIAKLVFWNGREADGGKGLADLAAKCLAKGKELSCLGNLHSFDGRIYIDGQTRNKQNGEIATTLKHSVTVIPGTMNLGQDSDKQLNFEYQNWDRAPGQMSFFSRPRNWGFQQTDERAWKEISAQRMAQAYQGGDTYGYAIVRNTASRVAPPAYDASNPTVNAIAGAFGMGQAIQTPAGMPYMGMPNAGVPTTGMPTVNLGYVAPATGVMPSINPAPQMNIPVSGMVAPQPAVQQMHYGGQPY